MIGPSFTWAISGMILSVVGELQVIRLRHVLMREFTHRTSHPRFTSAMPSPRLLTDLVAGNVFAVLRFIVLAVFGATGGEPGEGWGEFFARVGFGWKGFIVW